MPLDRNHAAASSMSAMICWRVDLESAGQKERRRARSLPSGGKSLKSAPEYAARDSVDSPKPLPCKLFASRDSNPSLPDRSASLPLGGPGRDLPVCGVSNGIQAGGRFCGEGGRLAGSHNRNRGAAQSRPWFPWARRRRFGRRRRSWAESSIAEADPTEWAGSAQDVSS